MSNSTSLPVSTINVTLAENSRKTVKSIKLITKGGESKRDIHTALDLRAGNTHQETFEPPLVIEPDDLLSISACYSRFGVRRNPIINIGLLQDGECTQDQGITSYRKTARKVEVVGVGSPLISPRPDPAPPTPNPTHSAPGHSAPGSVHPDPGSPMPSLSTQTPSSVPSARDELVPTTDELIRLCPKFRVLVIGNAGVGKSTLIRKMFGVEDVYASDTIRGKADINQEFTARENERFVVHDSLGFEAGDEGNIDIVKTFVKERRAMPRLEDQLHAIWLCMEIPHSGGRFLEGGVERFLQHRNEIIGNIPLIVVLTKMDLLDIQLELEGPGKGPLESRRSRRLEQHCIKPLHKVTGPDVVPVAVSAMQGYYVPISNLLQATKKDMAKHDIHEAPRAMASIAQRVDMKAKIETSIAVGKRQYWQNLQKSSSFYGHTLRACLDVIRKDIVTVWNLSGLDDCLMDDRLIEAFVSPDVLGDVDTSQPTMGSLWRNLASEDFIPAAGQMVRSVMTDLLRNPYDKYQETIHGAEIFMSYIVNLTCVVQVIFLLAPDSVVKRECVDRAIDVCKDKKKQVNDTIKNFSEKRPIRNLGQDQVLKEIENLIWQYSPSDSEVEQLRLQAVAS